jgi:nitroreductase
MEPLIETIRQRHSVRSYKPDPVAPEVLEKLQQMVEQYNRDNHLHIQVVTDDERAFQKGWARYGKFSGVRNYIALVGPKADDLSERLGYWGEHLVLWLQQQGVNTCWVGLTFSKHTGRVEVPEGEKFVAVICFGYGTTQGVSHKIKSREQVMQAQEAPQWFVDGVDAALLAPTATNQQKFKFILHADGKVETRAGLGFFSHTDLGIVKYHFEVGAGRSIEWL